MTEENIRKEKLKMQIELDGISLSATGDKWQDVAQSIGTGRTKARIAILADFSFHFDDESEGWLLNLSEDFGQVKERISLALLFYYPNRLSRKFLSRITSVSMGSLANYLTKDELEVSPHLNENDEGLLLNTQGLLWAKNILSTRK